MKKAFMFMMLLLPAEALAGAATVVGRTVLRTWVLRPAQVLSNAAAVVA